jgi:CRP-like cAMP-binding protein
MVAKESIFDNLEQLGGGSSYVAEISDMLERADMFRDFERQEVEDFACYVQAYSAPKAAKVLIEGGRESYMFVVAEGKVDILKGAGDHKNDKKIATVRAGKTIGEMSLIDGMPHSATAVVAEPAKLLLITKTNFEQFNKDHPQVSLKLMKKIALLMSLRLRQTSGVLIDYLQS